MTAGVMVSGFRREESNLETLFIQLTSGTAPNGPQGAPVMNNGPVNPFINPQGNVPFVQNNQGFGGMQQGMNPGMNMGGNMNMQPNMNMGGNMNMQPNMNMGGNMNMQPNMNMGGNINMQPDMNLGMTNTDTQASAAENGEAVGGGNGEV